jgi:penicillin-binding protein 1A
MTTRKQTTTVTTRARQRRRARKPRRWPWLLAAFVLLTGVTVTAGLVGTIVALSRNLPSLESAERKRFAQDTIIYDRNGRQIAVLYGAASRQIVTSRRIPQVMKDATVAVEDRRFYEHHGVDFMGIARAALEDLRAGKVVQGGSTLTAQFVKQAYVGPEQTLTRKIREAVLAWKLEDKWSKDKILTEYLNTVFYGENSSGVQAASLRYFHKPVSKVTLSEAAMLAALPRAPSENNPIVNPKVARIQRNIVLDLMEEQGYVSAQDAERARKAPLGVFSDAPPTERGSAAYFVDYVRQQLITKYGARMVYDGGLKVYTSIDMRMQEKATQALKSTLPAGPDGSLASVEPSTGYIRAMTATTDWKQTKYAVAWQGGRQPGSAFKVFALAAVVEAGANPQNTYYVSHPLHIATPGAPEPYWDVTTASHTSGGKMNLVQATLASDNTVYAQLCLDLGPEKVVKMARKMGITSPLDPVPSIVLGSQLVNPLEMSVAYATLASGGIYHKPLAIEKVVFPDGRVETTKVKGKRVLSEGVAYVVDKILQQNTVSGTASAMPSYYKGISAGKTGTTDKGTDLWFCGFNPRLSTAVWMGYFKQNTPMPDAFGATYCVPVWGKFYNAVFGTQTIPDFVKPAIMPTWKKWKGKYAKGSPSPKASKSKKPSASPSAKTSSTPKPSPTPSKTKTPTPTASPTPTPTETTPKPVQGLLEELVRETGATLAGDLRQRAVVSSGVGPPHAART